MSDSEKLLGLAFGIAAPVPNAVTVPDTMQGDLPAKFQRNTHLAIDAAAEILKLKLNPESPNYGTELRAVTAASGAQITAQLKVDETTIKVERHSDMTELLERIAAAQIKGRELLGLTEPVAFSTNQVYIPNQRVTPLQEIIGDKNGQQ